MKRLAALCALICVSLGLSIPMPEIERQEAILCKIQAQARANLEMAVALNARADSLIATGAALAPTRTVIATAYTWTGERTAYAGTYPIPGRTVAVSDDLAHLKGQDVEIKGVGRFRVEDRLPGNATARIDVYMASKAQALEWGIKRVEVKE